MKKLISLVLVLALAVSLAVMPVSAAAGYAETAGETDRFYEALKYVEDNGIYLPEDCTIDDVNTWLNGSVTRGEYATWLARFVGVNAPAAQAEGAVYTLDTTNDLAEMAAGTKADGETETVGAFTIHYGAKTKIDGSSKSFEDGYEASQRLNFQGKTVFGETVSYAVSFTTSAAASVKIWWVAGGDGREFTLFDAEGNALSATAVEAVKNSLYISELSVPAAGTYYLGLESGSNYLFKLEVAETGSSAGSDELVFPDMGEYVGTEMYNAVAWGKENGYINGYADGNFYPNKLVSREEICALIARYFRSNGWAGLKVTDNITYFVDEAEFSDYTIEEQNVVDCVKYGIIHGRANGRFDAKGVSDGKDVYTTREQMAAIFFRAAGHPVLTTVLYGEASSNGNIFSVRVNEHFTVVAQIANGSVSASNVTVKAETAPLPSIGLNVAHVLNKTFTTSNNTTVNLADWLDKIYTFENCTVNADIEGIAFSYEVWSELDADGNMTVIAMPQDTPATREAYNRLLETVEYTTDNTDGAYALLTNGSYAQIGETLAAFNRGTSDLVIDSKDVAAAKAAVADRLKVTSEVDSKIEVFTEAGITAAYGARKVALVEDVLVEVSGIDATDLGALIYETYEAYEDGSIVIEQLGLDLIDTVNALIESLSGSTIDVVVTLG